MSDVRWRKVWRDAVVHLPRTILVVLAMAVTLAGAGTVLVSWALVRRATIEGYHASDPPAATLHLDRVSDAVLAIARTTPGIRVAQGRRSTPLPMQVGGTWHSGVVFSAPSPADLRLGKLEGDAGPWPPPDGTIAVERSSVAFAGAAIGDTVFLAGTDSVIRPVVVSAIVRDVGLAPGWMEHVVYAWASTRTLELLGLPSHDKELQVGLAARSPTRAEVSRVATVLRERLVASGHAIESTEVPEPGEHVHAAQMDSLLMTQGAFGLLALLVGAFLVVNLMTAILAREVRQVGIMKTLGASPEDLRLLYLTGAAGAGALATLLALPVAWRLGRAYAALRGEMLNFDVARYAVPGWSIALLVLAGIGVPVLAAWGPVRRGTRVTVAAALGDSGLSADVPAASLLSMSGGSRLFALTLRNAFRARRRLVLTMATLAMGGAVFMASGNLRRAVSGAMDLIYGSQRYALSLRLQPTMPVDEALAVVRQVDGVRVAEAWSGARGSLTTPEGTVVDLPLVGVHTGTELLALSLADGTCIPWGASAAGTTGGPVSSPAPCPDALLLSRSSLRLLPALVAGDSIALTTGGATTWWHVAGFFDGPPTPQAYTSAASLAARGIRGTPSLVVATALEGLPLQVDLIARARTALGGAGIGVSSSQRVEEARRVTEDHLLMVVQFLGTMGWVMIVVGGMGLASTMGLAVLERTREIGVMRAIGASHRMIGGLIQGEGIVIALLAWAIALPLSLPFSLILGEAFSRIMLRVATVMFPVASHVFAWLGISVVLSVVACAWPARRAMGVPVATAIRD